MPANKKHLLKTGWAKASKVLAAILGSLATSLALHIALALWVGFDYVVPTSTFSVFIVWTGFMLLVYRIEKPWKSWAVLLIILLICIIGILFKK